MTNFNVLPGDERQFILALARIRTVNILVQDYFPLRIAHDNLGLGLLGEVRMWVSAGNINYHLTLAMIGHKDGENCIA